MRNTDLFPSRDASHPMWRLCHSGPANTQWNRSNFMTRKVPIEPRHQYRNVIVHNCRRRSNPRQLPDTRANHPEKGF
jgi:hypothetical protein